jgi:hypothetical protein
MIYSNLKGKAKLSVPRLNNFSLPMDQVTMPERRPGKMESRRHKGSDSEKRAWQQQMRRAVIYCILVGLFFMLLSSCASSIISEGTKQQTLSTPGKPTPHAPQLTQQYEFTEQDSGRSITYTITSRFEIILNSQKYPRKNVEVSCQPKDTLGSVSNLPSVAPPFFAVRYEGVESGTCIITNGKFRLLVMIVASQ